MAKDYKAYIFVKPENENTELTLIELLFQKENEGLIAFEDRVKKETRGYFKAVYYVTLINS